jgi:hypothetical protein
MEMHRRSFVKGLGLAFVAATARVPLVAQAVAAAAPKPVSYAGRLYRNDGTGRIFVSEDAGTTWTQQTDLGAELSVMKLAVDRGNRLNAIVSYRSSSFGLVLAPDLKAWRTI